MKKFKINLVKKNETLEMTMFMDKAPYIVYKEEKYDCFLPGSILKCDSLEAKEPLPKGIYGAVIDDIVFFVASGISPQIRVIQGATNPTITKIVNKKERFIMGILFAIIIASLLMITIFLI